MYCTILSFVDLLCLQEHPGDRRMPESGGILEMEFIIENKILGCQSYKIG